MPTLTNSDPKLSTKPNSTPISNLTINLEKKPFFYRNVAPDLNSSPKLNLADNSKSLPLILTLVLKKLFANQFTLISTQTYCILNLLRQHNDIILCLC